MPIVLQVSVRLYSVVVGLCAQSTGTNTRRVVVVISWYVHSTLRRNATIQTTSSVCLSLRHYR